MFCAERPGIVGNVHLAATKGAKLIVARAYAERSTLLPSAESGSSTADERNGSFFSAFQVSHKRILVLRKICSRPWNLPMQEAFLNLTNEQSKFVAIESR